MRRQKRKRERPNKQLLEIKKQKCNKKEFWVEMASIQTQTDFIEEKIDRIDIYDSNIEYQTIVRLCYIIEYIIVNWKRAI